MTFAGRTYSLEAYSRAFEAAGLVIELLREPAAPPESHAWKRWSRVPNFLYLRALKVGSAAPARERKRAAPEGGS